MAYRFTGVVGTICCFLGLSASALAQDAPESASPPASAAAPATPTASVPEPKEIVPKEVVPKEIVPKEIVPDYFDIIKRPIGKLGIFRYFTYTSYLDIKTIEKNLNAGYYTSKEMF